MSIGSLVPARGQTRLQLPTADLPLLVGAAALGFSALYLVSDLTYSAEAAIPLFVMGLYAVQRPRIGSLGLIGALAYAYTFVFFTSTVVYALVSHTKDWDALTHQLGAWITIHSALMVVAGLTFGAAIIRAEVLPRWTGALLMLAMLLMIVATALPNAAQTAAAATRDIAFAGMGASLLGVGRPRRYPVDDERPEKAGWS
jgi:hypothetical protein